MANKYKAVKEKGNDNFSTSIYEDDHKGILICRCNQNGRYGWQTQAILYGLNNFKIGKKVSNNGQ